MHVRVKGMADTQAMLRELPQAVRGDALREAALEGAEIIRDQAVANALKHKRTGTLAGDIHAEVARESLGDRVVVHIGPGKKGWYGRLLEMGHAIARGGRLRSKRNPGQVVGHVPPYPWLRPALDARRRDAAETVVRSLRRRIDRVLRRTGGRST